MKVGIMGSYGEGNTGDETILLGIIQQIRDIEPDAEIYVFSHNPAYTTSTFNNIVATEVLPAGIRSGAKDLVMKALKQKSDVIKDLDVVLVGGGGIFYDYLFSKGRNPIKVWHARIKRIADAGIPIYIYSVGVAKLKFKESNKLMKEICSMVSGFCVRDEESRALVASYCPHKDLNLHVVPDPAWYASIASSNKKGKYIGVNLRSWYSFEHENPKHLHMWADYLTWLSEKGPLKFLALSWRNDNDLNYIGEIQEVGDFTIETPVADTPELAFQEIETCRYVIGMRLHSQILAIKAKRRVGAIAYHNKVSSQLADFHVPILPLEHINLSKLKRFTEIVEQSRAIKMPDITEKNAFWYIADEIRKGRKK